MYGSLTAGDFKVDDDGTDLTASTVLMAGNKNNASATVSLTMPSAIITGSTAKVFYTQGTNRVKDVAGNELATLAEASGVALVGKSVAVSAVSTDDVINASEDDSAVLIAGTSTGLTSGTTVTVTVDDSDADLTADYSFTATTNSTGAWTTASSDLTSARLLAMDEGDLTITASASGAGSGTRTVAYDRTLPTVSSSDTGYYTSSALGTALSGSVNGGTDIYTKVSFSEVVDKTVANDTTARPVISYALGGTDTQYHIIASGTPSNGDCVESGTGASDGKQYTCRYTVGASDSGSFGVKVGTGTADAAGNALASAYTHSATLTADTTLPTISLAIYNGSTITLTMSESVAVSGTKTGADFTVTGGGAPTVSSYAISGSTVTLSLSAAITDGATVTLAYAKNSTAANRIADAAGNELAAVSSQSVSEKNVSVSAVSTDDYINATEDNSAVLIAGLSAGLTTGTTITITIDDSDADTNADLTFTDTTDSTGAWTTDSSDLTVARLAALEEGDLTITASATGAGSGTRTVVYDRTVPTVSSSGTGYYTSSALDTALSGSVKTGTDIYTKVVFTDVVDETAADDATARPEISYIKTGTQYGYVPGADITLDSANSNAQGVGVVGSRLYVANDGTGAGDKVFVYDLDGTRQSGSDFGFATIDYPYGIAGHGSSYLQVLDGQSFGYVQKFNLNGTVTNNAFFNRSGTESGVTVTPTHIFTSDSGQARMYKYTHTGNVSLIVSIASDNTNGTGIAFYNDLLYIVDATDDKVYVYNTSGAHQSSHDFNLTSANSDPSGMTALANGDLLVADSVDNKLYRYSTSPPVQYDVIASGTPASGDCVESGTGAADGKQYSCRYTVASGDGGSFTVKVGTGTGDAAGNMLASAYTHSTTLTLDTAVPTILSAVYTGSTITLAMSENVAVSGTKTGGDFTVTGGGAPTVSSYAISGSTVTLTLDAALTAGATVTLAYAKNATAANRIADAAGNELAAVSSQSVVEKNVSVSAVSTDDYINATEDNSAVLIAGSSAGLTTGTTVTITIDDSDADLTADYTFTATTNSSGAWTTDSSDLTSARLLAMDEGDLTITASASGAGSNIRTVVYDRTVPTATMQSVSGGYVDGTEDDSDVVLSAAVSGDTASVAFSATDSDTTPETLSKTGALGSVAYHEKLSDAMSALTLANSDRFGYGVARRGDVVAVGATGAGSGSYQGAVYLIADGDGDGSFADAVSNDITEIGGSTAGITLADSDNFGSSVALGDDVLVVGARKKSTYKGAVYVIANGGDDWGSIEAGDVVKIDGDTAGITLASYDYFGDGVALATKADGTPVLAVGAGGDDTGGTGRGAVYLIDGGTDKSFATIASGDVTKISSSTGGITLANSNEFGASVALAVDTDTGNASGLVLVVGAVGADTVYLLRDKNNDGDYADTGENTVLSNATAGISVGSNDELGRSVAVAGNLLAIGYSGDIGGGNPHGGFYLVGGGDDRWGSVVAADVVQITEYANSNTLGFSLAFDGGALIAGAMRESSDKGAAYLYDPMFTAQLATGDFEKGVSAANKLAEGTVTVIGDAD